MQLATDAVSTFLPEAKFGLVDGVVGEDPDLDIGSSQSGALDGGHAAMRRILSLLGPTRSIIRGAGRLRPNGPPSDKRADNSGGALWRRRSFNGPVSARRAAPRTPAYRNLSNNPQCWGRAEVRNCTILTKAANVSRTVRRSTTSGQCRPSEVSPEGERLEPADKSGDR